MELRLNRLLLLVAAAVANLTAQEDGPLNLDLINYPFNTQLYGSAPATSLENPINLNTATEADLWFLSDSLATALLSGRESGPYTSWRDVAKRTDLPPDWVDALQRYFYLAPTGRVETYLSSRVTRSATGERIRSRLNVHSSTWAVQWVTQQDPGEYRLTDLSDISLAHEGEKTHLTVGAHRATWGLGLVLANEFPKPRGAALLRLPTKHQRIRPAYSNSNTGVLRGGSLLQRWSKLTLGAGFSSQLADIALDSEGIPRVVDYRIHNKPRPIGRENLSYVTATTTLLGWELGGLAAQYDLAMETGEQRLERRPVSLMVAKSYVTELGRWELMHENTWDQSRGASQTRLNFIANQDGLNGRLRLTLLYRDYPPGWTPLRGQLVGAWASQGNERGIFLGGEWRKRPWTLTSYWDGYRQQRSLTEGFWPNQGWEAGLHFQGNLPTITVSGYYRHKEEEATTDAKNTHGLDIVRRELYTRHYGKLILSANLSGAWRIRGLATGIITDLGGVSGNGRAVGASIRYRRRGGPSLTAGLALFDIEGWINRLYVYEEGLPGEFQFRTLYGQGTRVYGRLSRPVGRGEFALRLGRTWRFDGGNGGWQGGLQMEVAL